MPPIHDADPLLVLAIALASKRRAAALGDIVAAVELLNGAMPAAQKLVDAFARLSTAGLVVADPDGYRLTAAGEAVAAGPVGKADAAARLHVVRERLGEYRPEGAHMAVAIDPSALLSAMSDHLALSAVAKTNALVPKPKPPEAKTRGPGFRQRKPPPAKRKRH